MSLFEYPEKYPQIPLDVNSPVQTLADPKRQKNKAYVSFLDLHRPW